MLSAWASDAIHRTNPSHQWLLFVCLIKKKWKKKKSSRREKNASVNEWNFDVWDGILARCRCFYYDYFTITISFFFHSSITTIAHVVFALIRHQTYLVNVSWFGWVWATDRFFCLNMSMLCCGSHLPFISINSFSNYHFSILALTNFFLEINGKRNERKLIESGKQLNWFRNK